MRSPRPSDAPAPALGGFTAPSAAIVLLTGLGFGLLVSAAPTGISAMNAVLVGGFSAAVVALTVATPTWAWAPALAVCFLADGWLGWVGAFVAVVGFLVALDRSIDRDLAAAVTGFGLAVAFFNLGDVGYPRTSALAVGFAFAVLAGVFLARTPRPTRRRLTAVGFVLMGLIGLVGVTSAYTVLRAKGDIEVAIDYGGDAADHLADGENDLAVIDLERSRDRFARAEQRLDSGWSHAGRLVPLLAQNLAAVDASASAAVDLADAGLVVARAGDPRDLVQAGRVQEDRSLELSRALTDALESVARGQSHLDSIDSVWVAPPLARQVDEATDRVDELAVALTGTADGLEILPVLTGSDGPRTYLVVIGNPAEARDLGGFAAGFALVEADQGSFELLGSGRPGDEFGGATETDGPVLVGAFPDRFLEMAPWQYGQNLTAVPDLPTLAAAAQQILADDGVAIDGAVYLDPYALEALLAFAGPVAVPEHDILLDQHNTAAFFITDQYERFPVKRTRNRILEAFVSTFVDQLEDGSSEASASLEPLVAAIGQERLAVAPLAESELAVLDEIGLSGRIEPIPAGDDYLRVAHQNGGPNKLDAYLERSIDYRASVDPATGALRATVEIELSNTAPSGLNPYVTDNSHGYPLGTNRAVLAVHTPHEIVEWVGPEPEPALTRSFWEFGRWRYERVAIIAPGETVRLELHLQGFARPGADYRLFVDHQPLVNADVLRVDVETGGASVRFSGEIRRDLAVS